MCTCIAAGDNLKGYALFLDADGTPRHAFEWSDTAARLRGVGLHDGHDDYRGRWPFDAGDLSQVRVTGMLDLLGQWSSS